MPRLRHQDGHVQLCGEKRKYWKGHYFEYLDRETGGDRPVHRSLTLGWKSEMKKWEAQQKLRDHINASLDSRGHALVIAKPTTPEPSGMTLRQFWQHKYLPIAEANWAPSTRETNCWVLSRHILPRFGDLEIGSIKRFDVQAFLAEIATQYSQSLYQKCRVQLSAIFAEAVEQELLVRNPVGRIKTPPLRKPVRSYLSEEEISLIIAQLSGRDRLIVRMFVVLGLRPGEMFSLRYEDVRANGSLRIDESVWKGRHKKPKTEASDAYVWVPDSIRRELGWWIEAHPGQPGDLLFPSTRKTAISRNNFLKRTVRVAAKAAYEQLTPEQVAAGVLAGHETRVSHQTFRRSCATLLKRHGDVKDVQGHLRHAKPDITADVYIQSIPESVRIAVEKHDRSLFSDSFTFLHTGDKPHEA